MRRASRAGRLQGVAAVLGGALTYTVLLVVITARQPIAIKIDGDMMAFAKGFYPSEFGGNLTWAWTRPRAEFAVPGVDRRVAWRWIGQAMVARPPGVPLPRVRIAVDGVASLER